MYLLWDSMTVKAAVHRVSELMSLLLLNPMTTYNLFTVIALYFFHSKFVAIIARYMELLVRLTNITCLRFTCLRAT